MLGGEAGPGKEIGTRLHDLRPHPAGRKRRLPTGKHLERLAQKPSSQEVEDDERNLVLLYPLGIVVEYRTSLFQQQAQFRCCRPSGAIVR
jgi:hypothetical protein